MERDSRGFPVTSSPDTAPQKKLELLKRLRQKGPIIRTKPESEIETPEEKAKRLQDEQDSQPPEKPAPMVGAY